MRFESPCKAQGGGTQNLSLFHLSNPQCTSLMVLLALALAAACVEVWQGNFSFPGLTPGTWFAHDIPINITVDALAATVEWTFEVLSDGRKCVTQREPGLKVSIEGQKWFARGTGANPDYYSLAANLTNVDTLSDGIIYKGTWPAPIEGTFSAKKNAPRSTWQCPTSPAPPPAPPASQQSQVWPAPASFTKGSANLTLASDFEFKFASAETPATFLDVFSRYESLTRPHRSAKTTSNEGYLRQLLVSVTDADEAPPQQSTNESYVLKIDAVGAASLHAATIYGAMRGMETFSQLVRYQFSTATYLISNVPLVIEDEPRFAYRGFMVDTSRHFLSLGMLKRLIDSMSFAKMNVLHWHAVDDQSFPLQVDSFPQLQEQGAYSAEERYSKLDVADVVEFARLRGVRVMLEIDTPSHTACWCRGYGDKVCPPKPCKDGITRTPLDPSTNNTFAMIQQILQELSVQFPEELLHVGQDEVDVGCWSSAQNPTIGKWQEQHGFDQTQGDQAYVYAANRIEEGVRSLKKRAVQWWPGLCLGVHTGNRSYSYTLYYTHTLYTILIHSILYYTHWRQVVRTTVWILPLPRCRAREWRDRPGPQGP
jgi:hypothetical protein